jgi:hypothetical protein
MARARHTENDGYALPRHSPFSVDKHHHKWGFDEGVIELKGVMVMIPRDAR